MIHEGISKAKAEDLVAEGGRVLVHWRDGAKDLCTVETPEVSEPAKKAKEAPPVIDDDDE